MRENEGVLLLDGSTKRIHRVGPIRKWPATQTTQPYIECSRGIEVFHRCPSFAYEIQLSTLGRPLPSPYFFSSLPPVSPSARLYGWRRYIGLSGPLRSTSHISDEGKTACAIFICKPLSSLFLFEYSRLLTDDFSVSPSLLLPFPPCPIKIPHSSPRPTSSARLDQTCPTRFRSWSVNLIGSGIFEFVFYLFSLVFFLFSFHSLLPPFSELLSDLKEPRTPLGLQVLFRHSICISSCCSTPQYSLDYRIWILNICPYSVLHCTCCFFYTLRIGLHFLHCTEQKSKIVKIGIDVIMLTPFFTRGKRSHSTCILHAGESPPVETKWDPTRYYCRPSAILRMALIDALMMTQHRVVDRLGERRELQPKPRAVRVTCDGFKLRWPPVSPT